MRISHKSGTHQPTFTTSIPRTRTRTKRLPSPTDAWHSHVAFSRETGPAGGQPLSSPISLMERRPRCVFSTDGDFPHRSPPVPATQLQRSRDHAYLAQDGRCYYCSAPMWLHVPEELTAPFPHLDGEDVLRLRCTAEHLQPRSKGGKHGRRNIVAACLHCNSARHGLYAVALDPPTYRQKVQSNMRAGLWQPPVIVGLARLCAKESHADANHPV
jgi:hypothetical protein